jgi:hypothetical protein
VTARPLDKGAGRYSYGRVPCDILNEVEERLRGAHEELCKPRRVFEHKEELLKCAALPRVKAMGYLAGREQFWSEARGLRDASRILIAKALAGDTCLARELGSTFAALRVRCALKAVAALRDGTVPLVVAEGVTVEGLLEWLLMEWWALRETAELELQLLWWMAQTPPIPPQGIARREGLN